MSSPAKRAMARAMTEDELLSAIVEAGTLLGWHIHHTRNSRAGITQGHPGLPDVVAARNGRVLFLELKDATGQLTAAQWGWLLTIEPGAADQLNPSAHTTLGRVTALLVRPEHLDHVLNLMAHAS